MPALTEDDQRRFWDSMDDAQKESALEHKRKGASTSWAIRQAMSETKQEEVFEEAKKDVLLRDKVAAGLMGAATGASFGLAPQFVKAAKTLGNFLGDDTDVEAAVENQREADEIAKEIAPGAYYTGMVASLVPGMAKGVPVAARAIVPVAKEGVILGKDVAVKTGASTLDRVAKAITSSPEEKLALTKQAQSFVSKLPFVGPGKLLVDDVMVEAVKRGGVAAEKAAALEAKRAAVKAGKASEESAKKAAEEFLNFAKQEMPDMFK